MHEAQKLSQAGERAIDTLRVQHATLPGGVTTQILWPHAIPSQRSTLKLPRQILTNDAQRSFARAGRQRPIDTQEARVVVEPRLPAKTGGPLVKPPDELEPSMQPRSARSARRNLPARQATSHHQRNVAPAQLRCTASASSEKARYLPEKPAVVGNRKRRRVPLAQIVCEFPIDGRHVGCQPSRKSSGVPRGKPRSHAGCGPCITRHTSDISPPMTDHKSFDDLPDLPGDHAELRAAFFRPARRSLPLSPSPSRHDRDLGIKNAIRPSAIGKKNWLFIGHPDAGQRSAILYSLVVSCQRHGKDPLAYLRDVLQRLPTLTNQDDLTPLTPAAWQPS